MSSPRRHPMPTPKKPVTLLAVRLPTPLHRRLRVYAAKRGIPLQHLITPAVRDLLAKESPPWPSIAAASGHPAAVTKCACASPAHATATGCAARLDARP